MAPLRRRRKPEMSRAFLASAAPVKIGDRLEADRLKKLRQGWQPEALAYVDAIGELHYPLHFMANQTTRVRVYPAFLVDPEAPPVPLSEAADLPDVAIPDSLIAATNLDMNRLGIGQIGMRPIMRGLYLNSKTTGEMYLVGYQPDADSDEVWEIRGLDELVFEDNGQVWLRDSPDQTSNVGPDSMIPLPPDAYLERIWTPHLKWRALADSPMKPLLDTCEELLLASRAVRAALRSRLAGSGLALIAQELTLPGVAEDDDSDPTSDPMFEELTRAMLTPIQDEASAAAVIPIMLRAPADLIEKAVKYITFDRPIDATLPALRAELIGRLATGMDWPKELVTGIADLTHWNAWAVDEATFKGHIEPDVITQVDALTVGYARPMLRANPAEFPPELINRIVYWYDPTELVTKPDLSDNATTATNAGAAGRAAMRKYLGLSEDDKPDQLDEVLYALQHLRGVDPSIAVPILAQVAPDFAWPDPATLTGPIDGNPVAVPTQGGPPPSHEPGPPPLPDEHPAVSSDEQPPAQAASAAPADDGESGQPQASTGAMVAFYPTPEQAAQLAIPGHEPAEQIHVTLAYLGTATDLTAEQLAALDSVCQTIAGQYPPMDGEFGGIGRFTADGSPEGDPVIATVDVPGLASLRDQLAQHLTAAGVPMPSEHGFTPHATIAYVPADEEMPAHRLDPVPATFTALSVCLGGDRSDYTLTGQDEPLVAAANPRLAMRLLDIDRQLRVKLLTASDAALRRVLERAGARIRSKAAKNATLRASIAGVPNTLVASRVGPDGVSDLGVDPAELTNDEWSELQRQWDKWVARAQAQARRAAAQLADVPQNDPAIVDLEQAHDTGRSAGWQILGSGLSALVRGLLFNPHPDAPAAGEFDPDLAVPPGLIRQAMATAGGGAAVTIDGTALPAGAWGIGQGAAVQQFLTENGMTRKSYTWQHGDTDRPLPAHEDLDGFEFTSWDDPGLANPDSFPEVDVLAPGDHDGCGCDAWIAWEAAAAAEPIAAASPRHGM